MAATGSVAVKRLSQRNFDFREDIRTTQRSFKILRKLCRQYGMSFEMRGPRSEAQQGKSKGTPKKKKAKARMALQSQLFPRDDDDEHSSSESDCSSVDDPEGLSHRTRWEDVESILSRLRMDDRVDAMEDISASLNKSSEKAQRELLELDLLERGRAGGDGVNESLGSHGPEDMLAVQAVNRCMELLPELAEWTAKKAREREDAEKKVVQASAEAETREEGPAWEEESDSGADTELAREIDGKLQKIGSKVPPGADPDLGHVLDAQRREIRRLVQEIKERERSLEKKRLGMEFLHGKMSELSQEGDARDAIEEVLRLKEVEAERLKGQASARLLLERGHARVPTEEEVEESALEADQLRKETRRAREKFESMMRPPAEGAMPSRIRYPGADEGVSPRLIAQRRGAAVNGPVGGPPSLLDVTGGPAPAGLPEGDWQLSVSADLMKASKCAAALEEQAGQEELRAARAGELLASAEGAIRTLEETRVVFLTRIAESAPELLGALMPEQPASPDGDDEAKEEEEEEGEASTNTADAAQLLSRAGHRGVHSPPSPRGQEPEEDPTASQEIRAQDDPSRRLEALAKDEEWLRSELAACLAAGDEASPASPSPRSLSKDSRAASKETKSGSKEGPEDAAAAELPFGWKGVAPLIDEMEKLVTRVQEASRQAWRAPPESVSEEERASARRKLAVMNHSQLQDLLRSRVEGTRLSQEVVRAGAELDLIRANHFPPWPATLLRPRRASDEGGDTDGDGAFQWRRGSARPPEAGGTATPFRPGSTATSFRPGSEGLGSARRASSHALRPMSKETPGITVESFRPGGQTAELYAKVQELQNLRMQWWSLRQGPGAVVRRVAAAEGLVLDPDSSAYFQADNPPVELCEGGFFAQVHSSMTAL